MILSGDADVIPLRAVICFLGVIHYVNQIAAVERRIGLELWILRSRPTAEIQKGSCNVSNKKPLGLVLFVGDLLLRRFCGLHAVLFGVIRPYPAYSDICNIDLRPGAGCYAVDLKTVAFHQLSDHFSVWLGSDIEVIYR